jgi:hypothetical protein
MAPLHRSRRDCEERFHQGRSRVRQLTILIDLRGVLGGLVTRLLRDAYGAVAVGEVPLGLPLAQAIREAHPHVLITALDDEADPTVVPERLTGLLGDHPGLKILVVQGDGRTGSLWQLRPHREQLGELSPQRLIEAVGEGRHPMSGPSVPQAQAHDP